MEFRKLIAFGKSSLVMSLPMAWVRRNRLKKGDLLFIDERPEGLFVALKEGAGSKPKDVTIIIDNKRIEEIRTEIVAAYINNCNSIVIRGKSLKSELKPIRTMLHELMGLEIIEEDSTKIVAKDLLDVNEISIDKIIRRIDVIIRVMLDDTIQCIEDGSCEAVSEKDPDVNRNMYLALRVIRSIIENPSRTAHFKVELIDILSIHEMISYLERFGDQLKRLATLKDQVKLKPKTGKEITMVLEDISGAYHTVMKSFYARDRQSALKLELETRELRKRCDSIFQKSREVHPSHIPECVNTLVYLIRDMARSVIQME